MKPEMKVFILFGGTILSMILITAGVYYSHHPKRVAPQSAKTALLALADRPETVDILSISKPDSVFGKEFITDEEMDHLNEQMIKISDKLMEDTNNLSDLDILAENPAVNELMQRQMSAVSAMRLFIRPQLTRGRKPRFTGWKVKIRYKAVSESGTPYQSEFWCITDRTGVHALTSFEIPQ
jgi:hypothetical protein